MIEFIFTLDYEIYGNGQGSLQKLVYAPTEELRAVFAKYDMPLVIFAEVGELEAIEKAGSDAALESVRKQLRELYNQGFEVALHLHPQWYNALHSNDIWYLNYREYNICTLTRERIGEIVDRGISYLRKVLGDSDFIPFSFRAGNWLLQPTRLVAQVLAERGIRVDSSLFKGGLRRRHGLDYRPALRNDFYWKFTDDVNRPDFSGELLEIPIYTKMVPIWRMLTSKRVGLQQRASSLQTSITSKLTRLRDFTRLKYPLKLDFCRMTLRELTQIMDEVIEHDCKAPESFKPIVAIGHTKDMVDVATIEAFLVYLNQKDVSVSTFKEVYEKCMCIDK